MNSYTCIKSILRTEKSTLAEPKGVYLFLVDMAANKIMIKQAVEEIYKVKVKTVNTKISMGKMKRVRQQAGKTADTKRAYVTLAAGNKIDTAP